MNPTYDPIIALKRGGIGALVGAGFAFLGNLGFALMAGEPIHWNFLGAAVIFSFLSGVGVDYHVFKNST